MSKQERRYRRDLWSGLKQTFSHPPPPQQREDIHEHHGVLPRSLLALPKAVKGTVQRKHGRPVLPSPSDPGGMPFWLILKLADLQERQPRAAQLDPEESAQNLACQIQSLPDPTHFPQGIALGMHSPTFAWAPPETKQEPSGPMAYLCPWTAPPSTSLRGRLGIVWGCRGPGKGRPCCCHDG